MKQFLFAIALLLPCCPLLAKAKHAPLPDAVMQAKTIYLVNHTGKQATLDSAYNEFQKWGRFTIVQDKDADIVAVFERGSDDEEGGATRMEVFVRGDHDAAYETTDAYNGGPGIYRHVVHDSSAKNCVDDFRKRLGP
jgi:hypothetical protein